MDAQSHPIAAMPIWDRTTRVFHWINVLSVIGLAGVGTAIFFAGDLEVPNPGKVLLKTTHVWIGYVFAINLAWRLVWGFIGGPHARWRAILPGGRGYGRALLDYVRAFAAGRSQPHAGHNPVGRLAVAILFAVLTVQAITGLLLAGTDLYMPPFGGAIAESVAAAGVTPEDVRPYAPETVDAAAYADMRAWRAPVVEVHELGFFVLLALIVLHVAAVVITEVREGGAIVSAMFTGRKVLPPPSAARAPATRPETPTTN